MTNTAFQNLPAPPDSFSPKTIMVRWIDTIGYRYYLATNGLTDHEYNFRPIEGSMNMIELLDHMYKVFFFAHQSFQKNDQRRLCATGDEYVQATLDLCTSFKKTLSDLSDLDIKNTTVYLKRNNTTYPFWYLINGPIADILTHIGQINSWRRIAGNPVERISPFTGEPF